MLISIDNNAEISCIYSDNFVDLLTQGQSTIIRASHVEPSPLGDGWQADLTPLLGSELILGPLALRQEALAAEIAWIEENYLKKGDEHAVIIATKK